MPRRHGARAAADTRKKIAKKKAIPLKNVRSYLLEDRLATRRKRIHITVPGSKVEVRSGDGLRPALRELKFGQPGGGRRIGRVGKGTTRERPKRIDKRRRKAG